MRAPRRDRSSTGVEAGRDLAVEALAFIAADETRLERFLAVTGLGPHNLRRAAADPGFLVSVLDYLAADERLLVAFAAESGRRPEEVMRAFEAMRGPPPGAEP
ncbi:DUF3572 domain-containing protein [Roseiarcus sp.]|uniref:DUF3572 domain-containing protein n=1 Tax=Roseiarcus sp. TaxID=1969460 RepID=UPI003F9BA8BC